MGAVAETMRKKLVDALSPVRLEIVDDSDRHSDHAGARPGGQSHFNITLECAAFAGLSRIQRQRMVHGLLAEELAGPVHALSLKVLAPGES